MPYTDHPMTELHQEHPCDHQTQQMHILAVFEQPIHCIFPPRGYNSMQNSKPPWHTKPSPPLPSPPKFHVVPHELQMKKKHISLETDAIKGGINTKQRLQKSENHSKLARFKQSIQKRWTSFWVCKLRLAITEISSSESTKKGFCKFQLKSSSLQINKRGALNSIETLEPQILTLQTKQSINSDNNNSFFKINVSYLRRTPNIRNSSSRSLSVARGSKFPT